MFGGVPINRYVVTNQDSMPYINELVGGVTVTVPNSDLEEQYPEFYEGAQVTLDDTTIKPFLQYRDTSIDFSNEGRMERQRAFAVAYADKVKALDQSHLEELWDSLDSMKDYLNTALESCFSMAGMEVTRSGGYSGWEPNVDSPILKAMKESYKAQFGTEPAVKVIHAGLECGIIGAVVPGLDMISFGPTLRSPHSPDERCFIPSVGKFYDFVVATLENTPVKE